MDISDVWDADMYLDSLDPHSTKAECLRYLMTGDVPRVVVDQACKWAMDKGTERHRQAQADARRQHDEQEAAQQASQRAALQGPGPLGAGRSLGALPGGWIYDPTPPVILYDAPCDWEPWIIALKIAGFLMACTAWGIFCASV